MKWPRRILVATFFVGALFLGMRFPAKNSDLVIVDYLAGQTPELALWQALLGCFSLGLGLGGVLVCYLAAKGRLVSWRYRKVLGGLEAEIHKLRNLPLAPDAPAPGDSGPTTAPPSPGGSLGSGT